MAYRKRGDSWQVDVTVKGRRATRTVPTEAEAKAAEAQLRADLYATTTKPQGAPGRDWTVGEAFERTMAVAWEGGRSERTMGLLSNALVAHFGAGTPLSSITTSDLDCLVAGLKKRGRANGTINRWLAALSKAMSVAVQRGGLAAKPMFPRQREAQGRVRYLSEVEEGTLLALFEQWGKHDHADAVRVLLDTGMRLGELFRVEVRDIDWKGRMISIWDTKADLPRSVPMTQRVVDVLTRRRDTGNTRLFPYDHPWFRHTWDRAREHMGMTDDAQFVPHALRHTCASRLIQRGATIPVVQAWLGHKTITITMRYAHLAPANLTAAAALLEPQMKEAAE